MLFESTIADIEHIEDYESAIEGTEYINGWKVWLLLYF